VRKLLFVASALALGAALTANPGPSTAASTLSFGVPRVVDPVHTYGEPDIKVAPNGDVHVSGPQGTGVQRSIWNVSVDGGDSYRVVQAFPGADQSPIIPDKTALGPGGGDTEIAIARNGKVFFSDLWALICFSAATTTDRGKSITSQPVGCGFPGGDRQWMAVLDPAPEDNSTAPYYVAHKDDQGGYQPVVYQEYDNLTTGNAVDMSTDGVTYTKVNEFGTDDYATNNGNIVIDQKTGTLLGLVTGSSNATDHDIYLAQAPMNEDGSFGDFTYSPVVQKPPGDPQNLFPVLAMDKARNAYAVWSLDCPAPDPGQAPPAACYHTYYSYATAASGWATWSAPKQLDSPPSNTDLMPWVAAGGDGIIDVVWYATDKRIHPSDQQDQAWHVYMAQVTDADTANPTITQARATPHPMKYNDICLLGTGCITEIGNRNLADFFQVTLGPDGRARIVYDDASNGLMQPNFPEEIDHAGAPLVSVVTQSTGLNAWTGEPLTAVETTAATKGVTDPVGDALWEPLGGTNLPGLDIKGTALSLDGSTLHVKITTEGDSIADAATTARALFGQLTVRWQMGNALYYASVEQPASGGALSWYAGASSTVDLCSVSACDPHYITYPAPPAGGTAVTGTATPTHSTVYDIAVPVSAVGNVTPDSLLEEVMGFATVSATPAEAPLTNPQADADIVPIQVEGTRTFNFSASLTAASTTSGPTGSAGAPTGSLPATGGNAAWLASGGLLLSLALLTRRRPRLTP
jgi:hypothetical protein